MLLPLLISMRLRVKQTNKKTLAVKKVCVCGGVCTHILYMAKNTKKYSENI